MKNDTNPNNALLPGISLKIFQQHLYKDWFPPNGCHDPWYFKRFDVISNYILGAKIDFS